MKNRTIISLFVSVTAIIVILLSLFLSIQINDIKNNITSPSPTPNGDGDVVQVKPSVSQNTASPSPSPSPSPSVSPVVSPSVSPSSAPVWIPEYTSKPKPTSKPVIPATPKPDYPAQYTNLLNQVISDIVANPANVDSIIATNKTPIILIVANKTPEMQLAIVDSYTMMFDKMSQNPEASDALIKFSNALDTHAYDSEEVQIAKTETLGALFFAVGENISRKTDLVDMFTDNLGVFSSNKSDDLTLALVRSYANIFTAFKNSNADFSVVDFEAELISVITDTQANVNNLNNEDFEIAKAEVLGSLYKAVTTTRENNVQVLNLFNTNLGLGTFTSPVTSEVQVKIDESYAGIIEDLSKDENLKIEIEYVNQQLGVTIVG